MGQEFPRFPQDGKFPKLGKFPNLGNFPGIPVREIPGREKSEAIWEGGNGNFPLNIPELGKHYTLMFVFFASTGVWHERTGPALYFANVHGWLP